MRTIDWRCVHIWLPGLPVYRYRSWLAGPISNVPTKTTGCTEPLVLTDSLCLCQSLNINFIPNPLVPFSGSWYGPSVWSFSMVLLYFFFWTGSCLCFFHNLLPLFSCSCDAINSDSRTQNSVDSFLLVLLLGNWKVHVKQSSPAGTLNVSRFNSFRFSPILMLSFWICGATNPDSPTRDSVDLSCMVLWYDPLVWSFSMILRYGLPLVWSFGMVL